MPTKIIEAKITHISLVRKGANKKKFFEKSDSGDNGKLIIESTRIIKSDEKSANNKHILKCVVYEPNDVDLQGDWMDASEIEKVAHDFLKNYRNIDYEHDFEDGFGELVECYIAPSDMVVNGETIKKGSMVIGVEVDDDVYELVEKGEITGVSMAGKGKRVKEEPISKSLKDEIISVLKSLGLRKNTEKDKDENENTIKKDGEIEMNKEEMKTMFDAFTKSVGEMIDAKIKPVTEKIDNVEKSMSDKFDDIKKSDEDKRAEKFAEITKTMKEQGIDIKEMQEFLEQPKTVTTNIEKSTTKKLNAYGMEVK